MKNVLVNTLLPGAGKRPKVALLVLYGLLFIGGCSPTTFMVSKDCKTYFLGSNDPGLHKLLCASGDFKNILADSGLPKDLQDALSKAQCEEHSREKVDRIYASLTSEQQEGLKSAFRQHGYYINYKPRPNFRYSEYYPNIDFCPSEY